LRGGVLSVAGPGGAGYTTDILAWSFFPLQGGNLGPIRIGPLFPGANTVTLRAANCRGAGQVSRSVLYQPIPAGSRFILDHIEVAQAIQNPSNTVPLIAGKRTVARAFLRLHNPPGAAIGEVRGTLVAFRPNGSGAGSPGAVQSLNAITVDAQTSLLERRTDLAGGSLNFELPPSWTSGGRVVLQLASLSIDGVPTSIPCDGCDNRTPFGQLRFVDFEEAPAVQAVFFSVPYESGGVTYEPQDLDFDLLESWIRRAFPTPRLSSSRSALKPLRGVPADDFSCRKVNARLLALRLYCASYCGNIVHKRVKYYGLVSDALKFMRGCAKVGGFVGSGPAGCCFRAWDTDGSYADWYGAHELAHMYGRRHPGFCRGQDRKDDDFPYAGGAIGFNEFGFDAGDPALGLPMAAYPPAIWTDVMTYCNNKWISDYTYRSILARLRSLGGGAGAGGEVSAGAGGAAADRGVGGGGGGGGGGAAQVEALFVQGEINLTRGEAELDPFTRLLGLELSELPAASPHAIRLEDAAGRPLAVYPYEPDLDSEIEPGEDLLGAIDVVVPWVEGTRRVAILMEGVGIAARSASANAPVVGSVAATTIFFPRGGLRVGWSASDADGDPLSFSLLYSADRGASWEPIDAGLSETSLEISTAALPGSNAALFRVIATDGFHTASADLVRPITVAFKAPVSRILSPGDGSVFETSSMIVLRGEARDVEDGDLDGPALTWSSERAGVLGRGESLAVKGLAPGPHRITLSAQDSSGARGTASVEIEVVAVPPAAVIAAEELVVAGAAASLDGRGSIGLEPLEFAWRLLERPAGSGAAILGEREPQASFVADRPGRYAVELAVRDGSGLGAVARRAIEAVAAILLRRGDVNGDGRLDLGDPMRILGWLFQGTAAIDCEDAADVNDDGRIDLSDAVYLLGYLFLGGPPPAPPFPDCGVDPTSDALGCRRVSCP
jgi:hypothetical protein